MTAHHQPSVRNHLLAAMPPEDFARLAPALERVELTDDLALFTPGEPIGAVHFIEAGAVSILALMADGSHVEIGTVGREGMVGLPLLLEANTSPSEARVQMPGTALRLHAAAFREALERSAGLQRRLLRYALAYQGLVSQTAACNARHVVGQRLAQWLLLAHDRTDGDAMPLTHEFLSTMLGVRRAGITVAAGVFRDDGLIRCDRGHITVLDRCGLEAAACECHKVTRGEFDRLLDPARPGWGMMLPAPPPGGGAP
jgi:CRP-like cAMP-binding protein